MALNDWIGELTNNIRPEETGLRCDRSRISRRAQLGNIEERMRGIPAQRFEKI
jgi:hypothetical protein